MIRGYESEDEVEGVRNRRGRRQEAVRRAIEREAEEFGLRKRLSNSEVQGDGKIPYVHVQVDARTDSRLPHAEQPALDPASSSHDLPTTRLAGFKANPSGGLQTTLTPGFSSIPSSGPKSTSSAGFPTPSHQRPESSLPDAGLGISESREHRKDLPVRREVSVQTDPLGGLTHPEMCELARNDYIHR